MDGMKSVDLEMLLVMIGSIYDRVLPAFTWVARWSLRVSLTAREG
jgi:hypothetical protein